MILIDFKFDFYETFQSLLKHFEIFSVYSLVLKWIMSFIAQVC